MVFKPASMAGAWLRARTAEEALGVTAAVCALVPISVAVPSSRWVFWVAFGVAVAYLALWGCARFAGREGRDAGAAEGAPRS